MHFAEYVNMIIRRKNVFVGVFLTVLIGIGLYTFLMRPVYRSSSTVYVKKEDVKLGLTQAVMPAVSSAIDVEIEIVKSRSIAEQVVRTLHLDWAIKPSSSGSSCKIVEISASPKVQKLTLKMTGRDSYDVFDVAGKKMGSGRNGTLLCLSDLVLDVQLAGKQADSFILTRMPFSKTAEALRAATNVKELGTGTNVIEISYETTDAQMSSDIVNAVVQAYLAKSLGLKTQEAGKTVSFIDEQLQSIKGDLGKAENNLQEYKSSSGIVSLDAEASSLIQKYSEFEKQRVGIDLAKKRLEFALSSQQDDIANGKTYSPAVMQEDPLVADMARQLAALEVQKRSLMLQFTAKHPAVQNVQAQIDEIQQKIRSTYQTGVSNLAKAESDVNQRLATYESELRHLPVAERDLARYTRLAKVTGDIYLFLLQKREEARINKASTITNINVIDTAITPSNPVRPQKLKNLLIGFVVALVLGVLASVIIEFLDNSIKNESKAKNILGFAHLATVPLLGSKKGKEHDDLNLIAQLKPQSTAAEAFRALRTALHFSAIDRRQQVTVLTSAFPGEGKSTISCNLAITIAQTGVRTLLIDGDLHKSTSYETFGLNTVPGVTDILSGDVSLDDALQPTGLENLTMLTSGTIPPNPSAILGSSRMKDLVNSLRGMFDQIIIDAPPVLPVADAVVLASLADSVLIVMETGRVPVKAASRLSDLLHNAKVPVVGFVFNNKSFADSEYGYGYGYGYGQDDENVGKATWRGLVKRFSKWKESGKFRS